jgi:hypothetical protein
MTIFFSFRFINNVLTSRLRQAWPVLAVAADKKNNVISADYIVVTD